METLSNVSDLNLQKPQGQVDMGTTYQFDTVKAIRDFIRKSLLLIVSFSFTNKLSLTCLGLLNRLLGKPIRSVFLIYPAREKYAHTYAFKWVFEYSKTNPLIVGMYFQNFRIGLIVGTVVGESYFRNNKDYLIKMHSNLELIRKLIGAEVTHFSGTLPTEFNRLGLIDPQYFEERCELVAEIVVDAERKVRTEEKIFENCPVLLLGGRGSIGNSLKNQFLDEGREVHIIDKDEKFPSNIYGRKAILIDVSRKGVLESRMEELWSNLTILNESFPEPESDVVEILNKKGIQVYHVVGVKAKAYPSFQYGYAGGIPCCAANRQKNMNALVRKL